MKIEFEINEKYKENKIIICTDKITNEIQNLINKINKVENTDSIYGYKENKIYILNEEQIETIYSENKKVFLRNENGEVFEIKKRMYELEKILPENFIRISNSEIVNFNKVQNLDFKMLGTIILNFYTNKSTYVSRRYVKKIKEYLKI